MKSILQKLAGIVLAASLALGIVSCANDTETKIWYVEKTYCASVTFSSEDLGDDGVKVIMKTSTDGADIHYTTDGTVPTVKSTVYTAPVTFTADATVKAIAVKSGIENSPVSVAMVSIMEKTVEVEKPVEVIKYVCPNDKKEFATAEEAADCCGIQYEIIKKYICSEDNKEYDNIEDAKNCCGHIHLFDSVYSCDATYHWKKALCKHSDVVYGKDTHNWDSGIVVKTETVTELGQKKYTCVDCKFEKIEDYDRKTYSITYKNWVDTEEINPTQYTIADNIVLANPTKQNYIFAGWYLDSEYIYKVDKSWEAGTYSKDLVLYAKWLSDTVTLRTINSSTSNYLGLNVYLEFNISCNVSNMHHIAFVYGSQSEILISSAQYVSHTSHNVTTKNNYIIDGNSSASLQSEKYYTSSGWGGYSEMGASSYTVKLILAE